ncbi:hypothetical protein [Deinococcus sp. Leaf326]|uniref:hypothetical protein n=1 Tax=Deinococcus sp. Leaf326 TaxID=1736338 RepID=UPI000A928DE6|nr:hypothetical protein [Deinococcus sp. Leaf326]
MTGRPTVQPLIPYPADDHDRQDEFSDLGLSATLEMLGRPSLDRRCVLTIGLLRTGLLVGCGVGRPR